MIKYAKKLNYFSDQGTHYAPWTLYKGYESVSDTYRYILVDSYGCLVDMNEIVEDSLNLGQFSIIDTLYHLKHETYKCEECTLDEIETIFK